METLSIEGIADEPLKQSRQCYSLNKSARICVLPIIIVKKVFEYTL